MNYYLIFSQCCLIQIIDNLLSTFLIIADAISAHDKDAVDAAFAKHMSRFDLDWDIIKKAFSEYITE